MSLPIALPGMNGDRQAPTPAHVLARYINKNVKVTFNGQQQALGKLESVIGGLLTIILTGNRSMTIMLGCVACIEEAIIQ